MKKPLAEILEMPPAEVAKAFESVDWSLYEFAHVDKYFAALKDVFNVDVLSLPWTADTAYLRADGHTHDGQRIHVVVYKMEYLTQEVFTGMCKCINVAAVPLLRKNIMAETKKGKLYQKLKSMVELNMSASDNRWYNKVFGN
jgi:hypothetical protein